MINLIGTFDFPRIPGARWICNFKLAILEDFVLSVVKNIPIKLKCVF